MTCHFVRWSTIGAQPDLLWLPDEIIAQAQSLPDKRRQHYLQSRLLLTRMMLYFFGVRTLPRIVATLNGRPEFSDPQLPDFSISHTGNTLGILLSDEGKVGLDMEMIRVRARSQEPQSLDLTTAERAWLQMQNDPQEAAAQLWTIRQAVLKISGLGHGGADILQLYPASGRLRSHLLPEVKVMSDIDDCLSWACAHSSSLHQLVCWRYQSDTGMTKEREISVYHPAQSPYFIKLS